MSATATARRVAEEKVIEDARRRVYRALERMQGHKWRGMSDPIFQRAQEALGAETWALDLLLSAHNEQLLDDDICEALAPVEYEWSIHREGRCPEECRFPH